MSGVLEKFGWSYPALLGIWIVTTFVGCMLTAFIMTLISNMDLSSDPVYKERLAKGLVKAPNAAEKKELPAAPRRPSLSSSSAFSALSSTPPPSPRLLADLPGRCAA